MECKNYLHVIITIAGLYEIYTCMNGLQNATILHLFYKINEAIECIKN